jgi:putative endonuclease
MENVAPHMRTGRKGEEVAAVYLRSLGYTIYDRNVRVHRDEIDIIAYDPADKVIVFVEVKTRSHFDADFLPELNVTAKKKQKLHRSALHWTSEHAFEGSYRIDVVTVIQNKVAEHFQEIAIEPIL